MILKLDVTTATPVYAQIVDQIKRAIASGTLRPGDDLPSLREVAVKHRINPLTVSKAYKLLEHEGLIETRQGRGSQVSDNAQQPTEAYRQELMARWLDQLLVDAEHLGIPFDKLRALLDERISLHQEAQSSADEAKTTQTPESTNGEHE